MNDAREVNFDGIVGPTHHYGGLSPGNVASQTHRMETSSPKRAALQGLKKMKRLADLGIPQAVFPPQERPAISFLRSHCYSGTDQQMIETVAKERLDLLSIAYSASAMWAANAATVSPSADTADRRVHFTPANLISTAHRKLEPSFTAHLLRKIFHNPEHFVVHDPLSAEEASADEGAANHMRICRSHSQPGIELFVYGRNGTAQIPQKFPARQTRHASETVATRHGLDPDSVLFVQQNPAAIDAGVFHNDVISVANENVLLCHESAFVGQDDFLRTLHSRHPELCLCEIPSAVFSLEETVATYLFNSQLISLSDDTMLLLCPSDCAESAGALEAIERIQWNVPSINQVEFIDVRESMKNGGGPACLRLRVVLTEAERAAMHQACFLTNQRYDQLVIWVEKHYRDELTPADLADPQLINEVRSALDELTTLLELGSIYPFQMS